MTTPSTLPIDLPANLAARRNDAHRLAYAVVAQSRYDETGRFGLVATPGGFGTPRFGGADRQVRVEGGALVVDDAGQIRREAITTLAAAAAFAETTPGTTAREHDSPLLGDADAPLLVDEELTDFLGAWYHLGGTALRAVAATDRATDVSDLWLWPGHFDIALEIGDADRGQRATYGASPGDQAHPEPYLYVGAWAEVDRSDPFWNDTNFSGASLPYTALPTPPDATLPTSPNAAVTAATTFFQTALTKLRG